MTELADYYRALPALSRTLDGALLKSTVFSSHIRFHTVELFSAAAKLRNAFLFRECLIWIVGPNNAPKYTKLGDRQLRLIAKAAHSDLLAEAAALCQKIIRERQMTGSLVNAYPEGFFDKLEFCDGFPTEGDRDVLLFPWYFRCINQRTNAQWQPLISTGLMKSNLVLDRISEAGDDSCGCADYFLCAEIADEDLPWDEEELDW